MLSVAAKPVWTRTRSGAAASKSSPAQWRFKPRHGALMATRRRLRLERLWRSPRRRGERRMYGTGDGASGCRQLSDSTCGKLLGAFNGQLALRHKWHTRQLSKRAGEGADSPGQPAFVPALSYRRARQLVQTRPAQRHSRVQRDHAGHQIRRAMRDIVEFYSKGEPPLDGRDPLHQTILNASYRDCQSLTFRRPRHFPRGRVRGHDTES